MAYNLYTLNPPPNPFFEFMDHPFFRGPPPMARSRFAPGPPPAEPNTYTDTANSTNEKVKEKQSLAEDPPEVDPSTIKPEGRNRDMPFRGRGRFSDTFNNGSDDNERRHRCADRRTRFEHAHADEDGVRRHRDGRPCRGGMRRGPPPFMMGHPFFNRPPFGPGSGPEDGPPGHPSVPGAFPEQPPYAGRPGHPFARPEHPRHGHHGPHRRHEHPHDPEHRSRYGRERGPRRPFPFPSPWAQGMGGFDLPTFLRNLGDKVGVDIASAAENMGIPVSKFANPGRTDADHDFEPNTDIFSSNTHYTIHLSLPGAKKSDLGVDWDGDNSLLRVTGVVHRPEVDETMLPDLVVDGRKREVGVFEKLVRLGTKEDPASVVVEAIEAKMVDGVLVITVPKAKPSTRGKGIAVNADEQETGVTDSRSEKNVRFANYDNDYSYRPDLFNARDEYEVDEDEMMHDAATTEHGNEKDNLIDMHDNNVNIDVSAGKGKQALRDSRASTIDHLAADTTTKNGVSAKEAEVAAERQAFGGSNNHVDTDKNASKEQLPAYNAQAQTQTQEEGICDSDDSAGEWEKFDSDEVDADGEGGFVKINVK